MPQGRPKGSEQKGLFQRYQLSLIKREFDAISAQALEWGSTLQSTSKRVIGLGLMLYKASRAGNPIIIRKKGEKDREIIIV